MDGLYHCVVACAHLGNSTGHRTVTPAPPLLLTNGPVRYEAVLHNNSFVFACVKGCMQGTVWIEPDKHESMLHVAGQAWYVERVYAVV